MPIHNCDNCTHEPEPEAVVIEAPPAGTNENDVAIAEVEARASVKREELYTEQRALELVAENERLRGELDGMQVTLASLQPPEPEPVPDPVVITPASGAAPE